MLENMTVEDRVVYEAESYVHQLYLNHVQREEAREKTELMRSLERERHANQR